MRSPTYRGWVPRPKKPPSALGVIRDVVRGGLLAAAFAFGLVLAFLWQALLLVEFVRGQVQVLIGAAAHVVIATLIGRWFWQHSDRPTAVSFGVFSAMIQLWAWSNGVLRIP